MRSNVKLRATLTLLVFQSTLLPLEIYTLFHSFFHFLIALQILVHLHLPSPLYRYTFFRTCSFKGLARDCKSGYLTLIYTLKYNWIKKKERSWNFGFCPDFNFLAFVLKENEGNLWMCVERLLEMRPENFFQGRRYSTADAHLFRKRRAFHAVPTYQQWMNFPVVCQVLGKLAGLHISLWMAYFASCLRPRRIVKCGH